MRVVRRTALAFAESVLFMLALRLRERDGAQCCYFTVDILMCYNPFVLAHS